MLPCCGSAWKLTLLNGAVRDNVNDVTDTVRLEIAGQWDVSAALEATAEGVSENC